MSPELIAPERFGFKNSRPTKASDCYALGMVIYETISGNLPFHKHTDLAVAMKVLEGERPPRGSRFAEGLWKMLERCWASQPNDRPDIEGVRWCLEMLISSGSPPPGADAGAETDNNDWDSASSSSGVSDEEVGTTAIERSPTTPSGLSYPTNYLLGEAINNLGGEEAGSNPPIPRFDSYDWDTFQVTTIQYYIPLSHITHCVGLGHCS